jgi:hypothetical protein
MSEQMTGLVELRVWANAWSALTTCSNSDMSEQRTGKLDEIIPGLIQEKD